MNRLVVRKNEPHDIYIGRPSVWGNPYVIGKDGTRDEVIAKYRGWLLRNPQLLAQLPTLRGKVLACYCAPLACHGDVLVEFSSKHWVTEDCYGEGTYCYFCDMETGIDPGLADFNNKQDEPGLKWAER